MPLKNTTLINTVRNQDADAVRTLIEREAPLEERNYKGQTPLILATKTDQFVIAQILLEAGASPFAACDFGWTAGFAVGVSRIKRGPEFEALQRVTELIAQRGYQLPGPSNLEIKELVVAGQWPPAEWDIR